MLPYKNVIKFKGNIDTFINSYIFELNKCNIDVVYIDGLHLYDSCKNDIIKTLTILKPNIAICGHDYTDDSSHLKGVKKAVDEIIGKPDKIFCDTSWIKFL